MLHVAKIDYSQLITSIEPIDDLKGYLYQVRKLTNCKQVIYLSSYNCIYLAVQSARGIKFSFVSHLFTATDVFPDHSFNMHVKICLSNT